MKHPMQPIVKDEHNVYRFKKNKIVSYLIDNGSIDMNAIAALPFEQNDREQFAQLIGYSVSGYGDLNYASEESVAVAHQMCLPENNQKTEIELRNEYLNTELQKIKDAVAQAIKKCYNIDITEL